MEHASSPARSSAVDVRPFKRPCDLHGWKAIARIIGVGIRKAQQLEKDGGLPIVNSPGRTGVSARTSDLEAWLVANEGKRDGNRKPRATA